MAVLTTKNDIFRPTVGDWSGEYEDGRRGSDCGWRPHELRGNGSGAPPSFRITSLIIININILFKFKSLSRMVN
jgi:hypothetical protein